MSILKNKRLVIRSSGKQKRDYIYVEDVTRAYYKLYQHLSKTSSRLKIYNIGSKYNLNTISIVKKIFFLMNKSPNYIVKNYSKSEIKNQRLNFNKIKKELKWKPIFSLEESHN